MKSQPKTAKQCLGNVSVLHEDNHLLVVDKPAGLLSQAAAQGDDNLLDRCKSYLKLKYNKPGNVYLGLVHRLDRNVSGVVVLARTSKAASRLTKAFKSRDLEKLYLAVVKGAPPARGKLTHHLAPNPRGRGVVQARDGKEARLSYQRLASHEGLSLLSIQLETGRKHQIRAQLSMSGMPLVGDPLYGETTPHLRRPALLASILSFDHPVGGAPLQIMASIPDDLRRLLGRFQLLDAATISRNEGLG